MIEKFNSYQNVPSADQLSSLMVGLSLVYELVDDVFVQPTPTDNGFALIDMTKGIVNRLTNYLEVHNWFYIDVNGWTVTNGGGDFAWAAMAIKEWDHRINGVPNQGLLKRSLTAYLYGQAMQDVQYCATGFGLIDATAVGKAEACYNSDSVLFQTPDYVLMKNNLINNAVPPGVGNNQNTSVYQTEMLNGVLSQPINISSPLWFGPNIQDIITDLNTDGNLDYTLSNQWYKSLKIYDPSDNGNKIIMSNMAAASGFWSMDAFHGMAENTKNHQIELIASVLRNNTEPIITKTECQNFLNSLSPTGAYNLAYSVVGTTVTQRQLNGWATYDRWTNSSDSLGDGGFVGMFNNIDYMLFHNLYRLVFKDQLPPYSISENCFCEALPTINYTSIISNPTILGLAEGYMNAAANHLPNCSKDHFNGNHNVITQEYIQPFFPNYLDLSIYTTQYLTSNLSIDAPGILDVKTKYILCENGIMNIDNGGIVNIVNKGIYAQKNSRVILHGTINIGIGTTLKFTENSSLKIFPTGKLYIKDGGTLEIGGADFQHFNGAKIYMEGPNSRLILHKDIKLLGNQTFEIVQLGAEHGQIIIDGQVSLLSTSPNSSFKFIGKDKSKPYITLTKNSKLTQLNGEGKSLFIRVGTVKFEEGALIDARQEVYVDYVNMISEFPNQGLVTQDKTSFNKSDFSNVAVTANLNIDNVGTLTAIDCFFDQPFTSNLFSQALIKQTGRGFIISNCRFQSRRLRGLESASLTLASSIKNSTFEAFSFSPENLNPFLAVTDKSNIELVVNKCFFNYCFLGLQKTEGKLTVRCTEMRNSRFANIEVLTNCLLNISSYSNGGYNNLEKAVGYDQNILLRNAQFPDLVGGFNFIGACNNPANTIKGIVNTVCASCPVGIFAQNQWLVGVADPGTIASITNSVSFNYTISTFPRVLKPKDCPTIVIPPGPKSVGDTNDIEIYSNYLQDTITVGELLNECVNKISLITEKDSSDNLGAISLLDELFTVQLSKDDSLNNFYLNYGLDLMKMAVEGGFRENELIRFNNKFSFDPFVSKYVNAMMYMSDSTIDSTNYNLQYILEVDKAHLFRLTGHPEIGLNILTELEECGLDSLEQRNINFWKQEYEMDILIKQIGQEVLDSTIAIDTSAYLSPILSQNNFSFGSIIHNVNNVEYTNCDFFSTKNLHFIDEKGQLAVYPNPATSSFDILIKTDEEGLCDIKIYQMDGKLVCDKLLNIGINHIEHITTDQWTRGVFTLIATLPNKEQVRHKVVLN